MAYSDDPKFRDLIAKKTARLHALIYIKRFVNEMGFKIASSLDHGAAAHDLLSICEEDGCTFDEVCRGRIVDLLTDCTDETFGLLPRVYETKEDVINRYYNAVIFEHFGMTEDVIERDLEYLPDFGGYISKNNIERYIRADKMAAYNQLFDEIEDEYAKIEAAEGGSYDSLACELNKRIFDIK